MSGVEISAVNKRYAAVTALDDVSLTIEDGEFFALLGPSGSGKTTLLRAIAGFVSPDTGNIRVDGEDIRDEPVHKRGIGMVFQHYALFPHMNVASNVGFGLSVRGVESKQITTRVGEILELVELSGYEQRMPSQLSGGQQQRVALARALVTRPRVLLLDEPLGALDKRLRQQMQIELRVIQREVGITTVFVTHDQEEALTLSDRIALLNEGRVIQLGPPAEVYERPRSHFAASFLGDANFFRGRVERDGDGDACVVFEGVRLTTGDALPSAGATVTLAVRPEKMHISTAPSAGADNQLAGQVVQAVYAGSSLTYKVGSGEHIVTVFEQNREAQPLSVGESVNVSWASSHSIVVE